MKLNVYEYIYKKRKTNIIFEALSADMSEISLGKNKQKFLSCFVYMYFPTAVS